MSDGRTADARLERLLHVLPAAAREGGAALEALAAELATTPERIVEDIEELTARSYYQPGGWPDDVQIFLEGGRVRVWSAAGFERPVRLNRDETLCLALALRGGAASGRLPDEEARGALLERAERHLGGAAGGPAGAPAPDVAAPDRDPDPEGIRETILAARVERRPCALWYVKSGATEGSVRVVHPYAVCYAEGHWYTVAYCTSAREVRVFRLDRVLACDLAEGRFEVPQDFDASAHFDGGRLFLTYADRPVHDVRVRYSSRIARWVRERAAWEQGALEEDGDGSVCVRHAVTDLHWAVSHVLQYGTDAEIVEPAEVRALVAEALRGIG